MLNPVYSRGTFSALRYQFESAEPFPHVVLDDFLKPDSARMILDEFPRVEEMSSSRDYLFGRKRELSSLASRGPASANLESFLLSTEFAECLGDLTGMELFVDPAFHGGGFHQGGDGSFLDLHVDFNVHPLHDDWLRSVNVLLYLNEGWNPEFDGRLLITRDPMSATVEIEPLFNRAVIMKTDSDTYHGYRRMNLPAGITRKSVAAYAYHRITPGDVKPRTTVWRPAITAGAVKRFAARHYGPAVRIKNKWLGSGTARNR